MRALTADMNRFFCTLMVALLLVACRRKPPQPLTPAYYYWQTTLSLDAPLRRHLADIGCRKLYLKILDVGLDPASGAIVPYARLLPADTTGLAALQVIPVVFITNETLRGITPDNSAQLAGLIASAAPPWLATAPEWQLDCDWTASTRTAFFDLLKALRARLPAQTRLSATIRLHQYKFPEQTGVPPVDRGMLMCYNTGDIESITTQNSIFNLEDARKYLLGAPEQYPLPLDLALPVFSWTLVYRGDELWKILPWASDSLPSGILERGTYQGGHYLRPGDELRQERITPDLLRQAAALAAGADLAEDASIAFFHLDRTAVQHFPAPLIRNVCQLADSIRHARR